MTSGIEENVLGLEIAIDDIVLVEVLEGKDEFGNVESGALFGKAGFALEMPKELAAGFEICDEIELCICLE